MLLCGDKDIEAKVVSVRSRKKGDMGAMTVEQYLDMVMEEIETKAL